MKNGSDWSDTLTIDKLGTSERSCLGLVDRGDCLSRARKRGEQVNSTLGRNCYCAP